ncbi:DUF6980 family protein [Brucella endophytica]|uniref:DUF6980 family protein n=1 Tax=Brucella endophytica TaxID=1963359 RepID=UPI003570AF2E
MISKNTEPQFCCERMKYDLRQVCELHPDRSDCPDALIGTMNGGYGLLIHDGGSSMVEILYCPWCGTKLPKMTN